MPPPRRQVLQRPLTSAVADPSGPRLARPPTRPLGITGDYPDAAIERALAYQLRTPVSFGGGRERVTGLRLVDGRSGAHWGTGDEVEADAIDLLLAVSGRPVAPERLRGRGAARLVAAG